MVMATVMAMVKAKQANNRFQTKGQAFGSISFFFALANRFSQDGQGFRLVFGMAFDNAFDSKCVILVGEVK